MNACHFIGRLTADPELRFTSNNNAVLNFAIALELQAKKVGDKWESKTIFPEFVAWSNQAEYITKTFRKGDLIAVSAGLDEDQFKDKEGNQRKKFRFQVAQVNRVPGVKYNKNREVINSQQDEPTNVTSTEPILEDSVPF